MSDATGKNGDNAPRASGRVGRRRSIHICPHLLVSDRGTMDDVRVQSGYPIWNLVGDWMARGDDDQAVIADYGISHEEWAAAKRYYLDHKVVFDARIITNSQPETDDDTPPLRTVEEYFAWLDRSGADAAVSADTAGEAPAAGAGTRA